jgi:hypothetical protein
MRHQSASDTKLIRLQVSRIDEIAVLRKTTTFAVSDRTSVRLNPGPRTAVPRCLRRDVTE